MVFKRVVTLKPIGNVRFRCRICGSLLDIGGKVARPISRRHLKKRTHDAPPEVKPDFYYCLPCAQRLNIV